DKATRGTRPERRLKLIGNRGTATRPLIIHPSTMSPATCSPCPRYVHAAVPYGASLYGTAAPCRTPVMSNRLEDASPRENRGVDQLLLDAQELVVLRHPVAA